MSQRVVVTGGSGKAGRWIVKEFLDHGYDVLNLDLTMPKDLPCRTMIVDLTDAGQVHNALSVYGGRESAPIEAVVHFAAIPVAYRYPNDVTFHNNVMSTYHVLEACANLQIRKAVIASSESSYGLVFARKPVLPNYLPLDEEHPQEPEDSYGLSKVVNETTAEAFHRRTGMQVLSFRLGNILDPDDYARVRETFDQPEKRRSILWSYIDVRDVASACRLGVEKDGLGAQAMHIVADDTSSDIPSQELIRRFFPELRDNRMPPEGRSSLLTNDKLKRLLGWRQQYFLQESADY